MDTAHRTYLNRRVVRKAERQGYRLTKLAEGHKIARPTWRLEFADDVRRVYSRVELKEKKEERKAATYRQAAYPPRPRTNARMTTNTTTFMLHRSIVLSGLANRSSRPDWPSTGQAVASPRCYVSPSQSSHGCPFTAAYPSTARRIALDQFISLRLLSCMFTKLWRFTEPSRLRCGLECLREGWWW